MATKSVDGSSNGPNPTIVRKCSGPETAFNNISNNGGATIGCVMQINTGRAISSGDLMSLFDLLYQKYEILRLRFTLKNKILYWCEAPKEDTFNVNLVDAINEKKRFTDTFLGEELCTLSPHGTSLWSINFGPLAETRNPSDEVPLRYSSFLISFRCNHGFLDGIGVMSLFQDFGNIISEFVATRKMPEFEPIALSAPYEDLVPEAKFVWVLRQFASVGIRFVETFASVKKSLPNYYPVRNMLRLDKFKPRGWTNHNAREMAGLSGVSHQYFLLEERQLELFQKFRKEHKLSFSGFLMSLLAMGMMKYAFKGFDWPSKLMAFDCLRDTRMYFKDSYSNRTKYVTNYIGATMPVLFLARSFNEKKYRNRSRRRSTSATDAPNSNDVGGPAGHSATSQNLSFIADCLIDYSKSHAKFITDVIRKRSASMVTLKSVAYYLQAFADPVKAKRLFSFIKSKDFAEGRSSFAGFSNLGRVDSDPKHVEIQSLVAAIDISRFIYCINFIVVTIKNKVHITMSYPTAMYTDESMAELSSAIQEVVSLVLNRYEGLKLAAARDDKSGEIVNSEVAESVGATTSKSASGISGQMFVSTSKEHSKTSSVISQGDGTKKKAYGGLLELPVDDSDDFTQAAD